jgi:hypothetical protein
VVLGSTLDSIQGYPARRIFLGGEFAKVVQYAGLAWSNIGYPQVVAENSTVPNYE